MPDEIEAGALVLPPDVIDALESEVESVGAEAPSVGIVSGAMPSAAPALSLPPQGIPVTSDYFLNLRVLPALSLVTVTVSGQLLLPDGSLLALSFPQPITSGAGTQADFAFQLATGRLLSVTVSTAAVGVRRGFVFVEVWLQASQTPGDVPVAHLVADYLTSERPCTWPAGRLSYVEDGEVEVVHGGSGGPPAGSDWTFSLGLNQQGEVYAFVATLITSAALGQRAVAVQLVDLATEVGRFPAEATQAPSTTVIYGGGSLGGAASAVPGLVRIPMPPRLRLGRNSSLNSVTANLAPGDQWGSIFFSHTVRPDF